MNIQVRVKINRFSSIAEQLPRVAKTEQRQAAEDIRDIAQQIAPVSSETGEGYVHLRDTIAVQEDGEALAVVTDKPYAGFVEYGTYKMGAQPYLGPAAEIVWPEYRTSLERAIASIR